MTIFQTILTNTFTYIPRYDIAVDYIELIEQSSKDVETNIIPTSISTGQWYNTIEFEDTNNFLKENFTYLLKVVGVDTSLLWEDVVFVTNQPISDFSVNAGQYISNQTNNQFIIYNG
jgi:hypothetical protein